jgi:DNA-binding transcriptional LysR family regulator
VEAGNLAQVAGLQLAADADRFHASSIQACGARGQVAFPLAAIAAYDRSAMDLRQLRYFEAVARHRHFTRAAGELHVAQSALSQQVRRLEAELGVELLERSSRAVRLTAAGEVVLARARRVLAEADALRDEVTALQGLDRSHIALGTMPPMVAVDAPALVARFSELHPGVAFLLCTGTATVLLGMLLAGELDATFVAAAPHELPPELTGAELGHESLVAILPAGDERAEDAVVRLADLSDATLVSLGETSAFGTAVLTALREVSVRPRVVTEAWEPSTARALVAKGQGIAIVPRFLALADGPEIAVRPIEPPIERPVALAWHAGRRPSAALRAFTDFVLEQTAAPAT